MYRCIELHGEETQNQENELDTTNAAIEIEDKTVKNQGTNNHSDSAVIKRL